MKKVFTKLDLHWKYIDKEVDKWKFTTSEELFKPTVIFFGLMNLPTMFQTMMNKIL